MLVVSLICGAESWAANPPSMDEQMVDCMAGVCAHVVGVCTVGVVVVVVLVLGSIVLRLWRLRW